MKKNKVKIGITQGDINGVGYEVIIKTLMDQKILEFCTPVLYGSPKVLAYHRKALNIQNFNLNLVNSVDELNPKRANIINCLDDNVRVELGKSTSIGGHASFISLERAVNDLKEHRIDMLVTAPINKYNIQSKDFSFPGHTEYLKEELGAEDVLMIMTGEDLRVGVVTGHIPIREVSEALTTEGILRKIKIMDRCLKRDFLITKPKIGVLGLNPHAGDNGLIGKEEQEIIIPAIKQAEKEGILAIGPYAADGLFGSFQYKNFDGILGMYHDQGLIPFKALEFDYGVNYTAGLEYIRTSPAHGTAYDIAGKGVASEISFRQSLYLAHSIYTNRKKLKELERDAIDLKPLGSMAQGEADSDLPPEFTEKA